MNEEGKVGNPIRNRRAVKCIRKYQAGLLLTGLLLSGLCMGCTAKTKQDSSAEKETQQENTQGSERLEAAYDANYDAIGGDGLLFQIEEGQQEAVLSSYYDVEIQDLIVPGWIVYEGKEYPVTEIGESAFESDQSIQTVTFGDNIKTVDASAFYAAAALQTIVFNDALESVGEYAFASCMELQNITWGKSLASVGNAAFQGDESLETLSLPATVTDWGSDAFMDCIGLTACSLEQGAGAIGENMFCNCSALAEISLPDTIATIGAGAFWDCTALQDLTLPDSVLGIGGQAFYGTAIQNLRLPKQLSEIKLELLDGMAALEEIQVPESQQAKYEDIFKYYGLVIKTY